MEDATSFCYNMGEKGSGWHGCHGQKEELECIFGQRLRKAPATVAVAIVWLLFGQGYQAGTRQESKLHLKCGQDTPTS